MFDITNFLTLLSISSFGQIFRFCRDNYFIYFANLMYFVASFIKLLICFLVFTIVIATVTLIERKILSLVQRRVGPQYIGYKGRLQFIADALKLLFKHILIINRVTRLTILLIPCLILIVSYLF